MDGGALFVAVFLACLVEAVEALTIVLAAATARGLRPAVAGAGAGIALLALLVAALGPAITLLPLTALRLVVGALLLVFGLQWLRKAILRASGRTALHDEDAIFARTVDAGRHSPEGDGWAFLLAFKGVVLEGLEVVFIALTFGANARDVPLAALAAAAAVVLVIAAGAAVRAPLSRVPENALKFAVGVMLTAFGIFWGAEGAGAEWPGGDAALLAVVPAVALFGLGLAALLRRTAVRT